ncbi:DUF6712 family protein [Siphonobacter sp. SORGH_AS_0500]|uniref:DUF6712 family protein n=1 Tax=Siphonobacter sp. SORGH_AS_0500 TaxID=1864824 RepID=UPI00285C6794|nr:DUF6712 family protein [Siphonobacter sp. SORGH_AS_0500]MDR6194716.1 hypothetical protein [Siphonobacter sp. SORGH_AS_0500]
MIVKDIDEIRLYLGGSISAGATFARFEAAMKDGERTIRKIVGDAIMNSLTQQYQAGTWTDPKFGILFSYVQRATVWWGYADFLPMSAGTDGDNGLVENTTADNGPIRQSVLEKRINKAADKSAEAIEELLQYLFNNADKFDDWRNSSAYADATELFVNSGTALARYMPQSNGSYRMWLTLKWYLRESESSVLALTGRPQFDDLKAKLKAQSLLTSVEKELIEKIGRASSWVAYKNALPYLRIVSLPTGGLRVLSEFDGINNAKAPTNEQFQEYKNLVKSEAEGELSELKKFLLANADQLPLYKNSTAYKPPSNQSIFDKNKDYTQVIRMR